MNRNIVGILVLIAVIVAVLALMGCDSGDKFNEMPNNTIVEDGTLNVVGNDRCGEPIFEGQEPINKDDGKPCK